MGLKRHQVSGKSSFRNQLLLAFTIGIVLLATFTSVTISHFSTKAVEQTLVEQGRQATESLAAQSALALLYQSRENAMTPVQSTLAFPDVLGVTLADAHGKVLLASGERPSPSVDPAVPGTTGVQLIEDSSDAWVFQAPVYAGKKEAEEPSPFETQASEPQLLGFVRVVVGKKTLNTLELQIVRTNFLVSLSLALLLLISLMALTSRITKPIKLLADKMHRAQEGEEGIRADLVGPKEIVEMGSAFNTMMSVLEEREQELTRARDAALEAANAKGEFAANVSHELRTPMNGILGMLELMHDTDMNNKQSEYLQVAQRSAESLLILIDDILDFSRIESGTLKPHPVDFYLQDVLDDVMSILSSQAQRKELDLGYVIEQYVPTALRGEPTRIRQVLINLVGNAIKFTERGEIAIEVRVVEERQDRVLMHFEVSDTGIGIPPDAQKRIFEAFAQADGSTTRKYGGTGLGLAICKQIVTFLGGQIDVRSEPDKGSTFWFEVPVDILKDAPEKTDTRRHEVAGLRVLIVDDSTVNRSFLEKTFGAWGMYQNSAAGGEEALEMMSKASVEGRPYDLVILDELMPVMAGHELSREIKTDPALASAKVILMTTRRPHYNLELRRAGVAGIVAKPVRQSLLFDCISTITKGSSEPEPQAGGLGTAPTAPSHALVGRRILVAEDNQTNQQVVVGMLERLGCQVRLASTGKAAIDAVKREAYDLILMDCQMPEMDGYEATACIRVMEGDPAAIPVIAMTANVHQGEHEKCLRSGMDDYLPKPLKLKRLREKLEKWLGNRTLAETVPALEGRAGPAGQGDDAGLDYAALNELREDTGEAFGRMIKVFVEDLPAHIRAIEDAVAANDAAALTQAAHSLKGSSGNLGAQGLSRTCARLESSGRQGVAQGLGPMIQQLRSESERAVKALLKETSAQALPKPVLDPDRALRVLIVDDDRATRIGLRQVLESDGYWIEEAVNGAQAVSVCERRMPDLVLMDAVMPVVDGFEACEYIRQLSDGGHTPVLIITALDDEQSIENAFSAGATDYIPKPLHFGVLRQRIARLLQASQAEKHVRHLAYNDPLTGLRNRAMFTERLTELLARPMRADQVLAILFLDLDRFKMVNDTLGHDVGDMLLKAVAERISGCVRSGDMVARLGGDEFTLILENINAPEVAASVAEKICKALAEPFTFMAQEMFISTSIGISLYPQDGRDIGTLMKHADTAMFRAKEGGGSYQFYEMGMEAAVSKQLELQNDLRRALDRNELRVFYQPQADLETGAGVGMEALVRWEHPTNGMIPPSEFIPLAEEMGLIHDLGQWVLETACAQLKVWTAQGYGPLRLSVNLSGLQLERHDCTKRVGEVLAETGLDPSSLELEITESTIMNHPEEVIAVLRSLKEMGVKLAIDDFGTGYSSLSYL